MKVTVYKDPLSLMLDVINDRRKTLILYELEKRKKQSYEISVALSNITRVNISEELVELVEMGLVARKIHVRKQPRCVEYALTNEGAQLLRCIRNMMDVGIGVMMRYNMEQTLESKGYVERVEPQLQMMIEA